MGTQPIASRNQSLHTAVLWKQSCLAVCSGSSASRCVCDRPTREEVDTRVLLDGGETKFLHLMEMIEGEAEMPGTVS